MIRALVLAVAGVLSFGCADEVVAEHQANVDTGPGAEHVRFAALDGCCDLVAGAPARGQLDVVMRRGDRWEQVGSFYAAPQPIRDVVPASVGGRPSLYVQAGEQEVTLLSADLLDPHRLRDPVRVFEGGVHAIAAGDLDRDGIDELVVATGDRIVLVDRTEWALFEDPSEFPRVESREIDGAFPATSVVVAEITGDGALDVVAFHREQGLARVYDSPGIDHEGQETRDVELSATAVSATATGCPRSPVVAALDDGSLVAIPTGTGGELREWPAFGTPRALFTSGDSVAVVYEDGAPVTLHSACGGDAGSLGVSSEGVLSVAIERRTNDARRLAIAREDAAISVYSVESPF